MKLKKYLFAFLAVAGLATLAACSDDEGTEPGNDGSPVVTVYTYAPGEDYNSDEDVLVRIVPNNQVSEIYYHCDLTSKVDEYIAANGEGAYTDYVIESGTKLEAGKVQDIVLTGLLGQHTISVVGVAGNGAKSPVRFMPFTGLTWAPVVQGTITFGYLGGIGLAPRHVELQICDYDESLYRVKDMYKEGAHLKFSVLDMGEEDGEGNVIKYCRVANQDTGLSLTSYGAVGVQDVGYWQGSDSFVTGGGFENRFYVSGPKQYQFEFMLEYFVSAGALDYTHIDTFVPDAE